VRLPHLAAIDGGQAKRQKRDKFDRQDDQERDKNEGSERV
jgi:hypothetical protein